MQALGPQYGFGLYVHWPYCARICPYCDFNVYAAKARDNGPLLKAIRQDLTRHAQRLPTHPPLDSVFLGGGTPSLLSASDIANILETAQMSFGFAEEAEVTIEANPADVMLSRLKDWQAAGINRVSLGIQSLDDEALTFLGRDHDVATALNAADAVQSVFDNHSIDLIYARPGQSLSDWENELQQALALGAPHLSLYELTIAERTAFGKRAERGELIPMPDDDQADLYEATQRLCDSAGLPAYEVSNHARSSEYESRHNHIYWANGDWIGVGPGAHGRLTVNGKRTATEAARKPSDYIETNAALETDLTPIESAYELIAMGLRPISGLDKRRVESLIDQRLNEKKLHDFRELGMTTLKHNHIQLTSKGRLLADYIAKELAP